jgi:hypothetical protein
VSITADNFKSALEACFSDFFSLVATNRGDWTVKGFIDIYKNIYTIGLDTKVVSKVIELMIFPVIVKFAQDNELQMILSSHQNHYPDITFIAKKGNLKIALDLKSTYRIASDRVNGMTLGAFTGYFRNRSSTKNITFPYSEYSRHYILGVIYTQADQFNAEKSLADRGIEMKPTIRRELAKFMRAPNDEHFAALHALLAARHNFTEAELRELLTASVMDERKRYKLADLQQIVSVIRDFDFFVQEKWRIAIDRPGSGNTKNIGSSCLSSELKNGAALFTKHPNGQALFDDYWMYYLTKDMAKAADLPKRPYTDLKSYFSYRGMRGK